MRTTLLAWSAALVFTVACNAKEKCREACLSAHKQDFAACKNDDYKKEAACTTAVQDTFTKCEDNCK